MKQLEKDRTHEQSPQIPLLVKPKSLSGNWGQATAPTLAQHFFQQRPTAHPRFQTPMQPLWRATWRSQAPRQRQDARLHKTEPDNQGCWACRLPRDPPPEYHGNEAKRLHLSPSAQIDHSVPRDPPQGKAHLYFEIRMRRAPTKLQDSTLFSPYF